MRLERESIDGLSFGLSLASNPQVQARRKEYEKRLNETRQISKDLFKVQMIEALSVHNPAYLVPVLESQDEGTVRERYVHTFLKQRTQTTRS